MRAAFPSLRRPLTLANCGVLASALRTRGLSAMADAPQRVGIVGSGAVGTYFGVRLAQAGHDVRFLVSPRHELPPSFSVSSWQGDFVLEQPKVARTPAALNQDEPLDWVVVCLKSTALEHDDGAVFDSLVAPCVADTTRVRGPRGVVVVYHPLCSRERTFLRTQSHRTHRARRTPRRDDVLLF